MSGTVVALLDAPSSKAFGMAPFVLRREDGQLVVMGISELRGRPLDRALLDLRIRSGDALEVAQGPQVEGAEDAVAGWIGAQFLERLENLGEQGRILAAPLHRRIGSPASHGLGDRGYFWITGHARLMRELETWVQKAGHMVLQNVAQAQSRDLAEMMDWTLPESALTQAALLFTSCPEDREQQLRWTLRLRHGQGHSLDEEALLNELEHLRARLSSPTPIDDQLKEIRQPRDEQVYPRSREYSPTLGGSCYA
jgi:hypothetical protein